MFRAADQMEQGPMAAPAHRAARRRLRRPDLSRLSLACDLAEDIGSARWYRGLASMVGLAACALAFWPDFSAVAAAPGLSVDDVTRDEFRSQMIAPLAFGGDSGRRMGPGPAVVPIAAAPERPSIELTATVAPGDDLSRALRRVGVGAGDAAQAAAMVAGEIPGGRVQPGTALAITLGRRAAPGQPRPLDRVEFAARFDLELTLARSGGGLSLQRRPVAVDATPLRIRGTVGQSLYRSARSAGAPVKAIQRYLQAIDAHMGLDSDIAAADTFDLVVSYKRSANGGKEVGELLYAGLEKAGQPRVQLVRWGGEGRLFDAAGIGQPRTAVFAPVAGRLTSGFGMRRHPILGYSRMHAGIDFGAGHGAPIFAVSDGAVRFAGRRGGHGNYVRLDHGGGMATGYSHMSRIAVAPGSWVRAGQVIGYVGSTGLSTGPHLHYEVYRNGVTVNPLSVRFAATAEVDPAQLAAFKARLAALKKVVPGAALNGLGPRQAQSATRGRADVATLAGTRAVT